VVADAEEYYRTVFRGQAASWNLRDRHMADTLDELVVHLDRWHGDSRVVVWAHNSHIGDARQTEMSRRGELNIGQLAGERHPAETVLVGFSTYSGTVTAARDWGSPAERRQVRPARLDSYEALYHAAGRDAFLLPDLGAGEAGVALRQPRLERAIGVIYRPETERESHYFAASASMQFDALVHIDRSRAVEPLERNAEWMTAEPPETYPSGL
jgi:erythromycin esterase-like protein